MHYLVMGKKFDWDDKGLDSAYQHAVAQSNQLDVTINVYVCSEKKPDGFVRAIASPGGGIQVAY